MNTYTTAEASGDADIDAEAFMNTYTTAEASADRLKTKQMAVTSSVDDVQGASVDSFQHTKFIERSHKRGSANFVPKRTRYVDSNVTNDITH